MHPITKSGQYKTDHAESFLFIQDESGSRLVSGKDCLLRYFPDPAIFKDIDSILLSISREGIQERELFVPKSGFFLDPSPSFGPNLGILIKAFMISQSGHYQFFLACMDKDGKKLSTPTLPFFFFAHDIDQWVNGWIPRGLAI
jgi:hypothetical protein